MVLQIDLRGAPLKAKMKGFQRNTKGLMEYLKKRDGVKQIKVSVVRMRLSRQFCSVQQHSTSNPSQVLGRSKMFVCSSRVSENVGSTLR